MKKRTGTLLAGIIFNYIGASLILLVVLVSWIEWGWLTTAETILLAYSVLTIYLTYSFHSGASDNQTLVGILGIFVSLIGGILILSSTSEITSRTENNTTEVYGAKEDGYEKIKKRLDNLKSLYDSGEISYQEYENRRREILNQI